MKRFPRFVKFSLLGLALVAGLGLVWFAVANARANARLETAIDALRAAGQPVSLAELARKPIEPQDNAATYLRRAHHDLRAIELEFNPVADKASEADQESFYRGHAGGPVYEAAKAALTAYPHLLPLLKQAADAPDYDPQFDCTATTDKFLETVISDYTRDLRSATRVLSYQAMLQLADGDREGAMQTCLAMWRLARHLNQDPLNICYLVALAVRGVAADTTNHVLRAGPLAEASYAALDAELARQSLAQSYVRGLQGERAFVLQRFRDMSNDRRMGYLRLPSGKNDESDYLELFDLWIADAALPYYEQKNQDKIHALLESGGALTRAAIPTAEATTVAAARAHSLNHCLRVLNAIVRREAAAKMDQPELAELGLPADVTVDPFNGQPLHLKKLPDGWLVYSVNANLKDDDGEIAEINDVGLGPPSAERTQEH